MASLLNLNEIPNLLELVEAHQAAAMPGGSGLTGVSLDADDRARSGLAELALCSDEGQDGASDIRLKTDIEQLGTTVYGLPLYQFRYKTGAERFEGVMAQDVLKVMPAAVVMGEDGYYRVKYGQLGIRMTRA